jgi:hypothetical protein
MDGSNALGDLGQSRYGVGNLASHTRPRRVEGLLVVGRHSLPSLQPSIIEPSNINIERSCSRVNDVEPTAEACCLHGSSAPARESPDVV